MKREEVEIHLKFDMCQWRSRYFIINSGPISMTGLIRYPVI